MKVQKKTFCLEKDVQIKLHFFKATKKRLGADFFETNEMAVAPSFQQI